MNPSISDRPPAIPPCATCDHPPVRLFVELAAAVETCAPAWYSLDLARQLAPYGYKVELIAPTVEGFERPKEWCLHLIGGRIASGLPSTAAGVSPESPASAASARHDSPSKAKADDPAKSRPPSLCGPGTASTVRGPDSPKIAL